MKRTLYFFQIKYKNKFNQFHFLYTIQIIRSLVEIEKYQKENQGSFLHAWASWLPPNGPVGINLFFFEQ